MQQPRHFSRAVTAGSGLEHVCNSFQATCSHCAFAAPRKTCNEAKTYIQTKVQQRHAVSAQIDHGHRRNRGLKCASDVSGRACGHPAPVQGVVERVKGGSVKVWLQGSCSSAAVPGAKTIKGWGRVARQVGGGKVLAVMDYALA